MFILSYNCMQVAQTCSFVIYACLKFCWKENKNDIAVTIVCAFVPFDQLIGSKTFRKWTPLKVGTNGVHIEGKIENV